MTKFLNLANTVSVKSLDEQLESIDLNTVSHQMPTVLSSKDLPKIEKGDPCPEECRSHCWKDKEIIYCGTKCKDW